MNETQQHSILRCGMENLDVLLPVYQDFLAYYQDRYGHLLRDIPLTPSGISEYLRAQFEQSEAVVFLAVSDSRTEAAAGFTLLCRSPLTRVDAGSWQIKDLFVASEQRGKGLGTRLIQAVCQYCESEKAASITLLTGKINLEARSLYEKCGFILDHTYEDSQNVQYAIRIG